MNWCMIHTSEIAWFYPGSLQWRKMQEYRLHSSELITVNTSVFVTFTVIAPSLACPEATLIHFWSVFMHSHKWRINVLQIHGSTHRFVEAVLPHIFNTAAEMNIVVPPNCVLCTWLETGHSQAICVCTFRLKILSVFINWEKVPVTKKVKTWRKKTTKRTKMRVHIGTASFPRWKELQREDCKSPAFCWKGT